MCLENYAERVAEAKSALPLLDYALARSSNAIRLNRDFG
jgi:hypothetical protein